MSAGFDEADDARRLIVHEWGGVHGAGGYRGCFGEEAIEVAVRM